MVLDQNNKQVERMRKQLASFIQGKIELGGLITELEVSLGAMENASPAWQKACFEKVGNLTSVYAGAVSKGASEIEGKEEELLVQNIYDLIKLTSEIR